VTAILYAVAVSGLAFVASVEVRALVLTRRVRAAHRQDGAR
jgi:hypothetical protein